MEARAATIAASGTSILLGWRPWTVARGGIQPVISRSMLAAVVNGHLSFA